MSKKLAGKIARANDPNFHAVTVTLSMNIPGKKRFTAGELDAIVDQVIEELEEASSRQCWAVDILPDADLRVNRINLVREVR